MIPEITIDATKALARFSPSGIPEAVRRRLRQVLPDLGKQLGALVNRRLDTNLKSRKNLEVTQELHESASNISVNVALEWTGDSAKKMVPSWLEYGTSPHPILPVNARALAFYWPKAGGMYGTSLVFFKRVQHPGFTAYGFMSNSMAEMRGDIETQLRTNVIAAMNETA